MKIKMKIKWKMFIFILSISIVIYAFAIGFMGIHLRKVALNDATNLCNSYAREGAGRIQNYLDNYIGAARIIAQTFEKYELVPPQQRRGLFKNILHNCIKQNEDFLAIWSIWEPNAIDQMDSLFIGNNENTKIGSFSPTFYRQDYEVKLESSNVEGELFTGDYYTIPKATLRETLMNPYYYSYTGQADDNVLQTSTIVPIIDSSTFLGVVGIDASLTIFQTIIDTIKPFKEGYSFIMANNGAYVAHPNKNILGKTIIQVDPLTNKSFRVIEQVQKGKPFSYFQKVTKDSIPYYISYYPIKIGETKTPWAFSVVIPLNVVMANANWSYYISILVSIIGLIILTFIISTISLNITNPLGVITATLKKLNRGNIDNLKHIGKSYKDEIGDIANSSYVLINWVNTAGEFAKQIGEGNLSVDYNLLSENDVLGKSLLEMRDRLIEARTKDEIRRREDANRNWASEGIAKFAEILRQTTTDLKEYSYNIISNLVRYVDANQGGLFLINDDDKDDMHIELQAAYAYEQRRYRQKRIEIGQTLIGRCIQEKETIFLTDIPNEYILITSGLGDANPNCLLIVPLMHNDETYGAIELASFKILEPYQIDFIEKVGQNIGATISTVKINLRTAALLSLSQQQSESLALQEEEMRQNMEELRASLDEANRREEELNAHLRTVNNTLITAEYDSKGYLLSTNNLFLSYMGYTFDEVKGKHHKFFCDSDYSTSSEYQTFWEKLRTGSQQIGDFIYVNKNKQKTYLNSAYTPIFDENGLVVKIIQYSHNVTRIYNNINDFRFQLEGVGKLLCSYETEGDEKIKIANKNFLHELGYKKEDIIGKNHQILFNSDMFSPEEYHILWKKVQNGKNVAEDITFKHKDGTSIHFTCSFTPITDLNGRITKIVFFGYIKNS